MFTLIFLDSLEPCCFLQLLAVLPTASKELLPKCYHDLMTAENSLISKYYPEDFQTDLNGKKQEWEAVVLVPFIDEVSVHFDVSFICVPISVFD